MAVRELRQRDERGAGYIPLLVIVLIVTVVAVGLLTRTLVYARSINNKAANIAQTGRGINASTDAIIQLNMTNDLGRSINDTAQPLVPKLNVVVGLANSINNKATSITASALTINSTAKTIGNSGNSIHTSAVGIDPALANIVPIANSIKGGVATINQNVMTTIGIAEAVRADVGNILNTRVNNGDPRQSLTNLSGCINNKTSNNVLFPNRAPHAACQ